MKNTDPPEITGPGQGYGEGAAGRIAASRTPRDRAITAAKVTAAMLAALAAFSAYAFAQEGPPSCPVCPPAPTPTPPEVTKTAPADGKTGFDRDANIRAFFSEDMDPANVNQQTFDLYRGRDATGKEIAAKVRYNAETDKAILNPKRRLNERTVYTAIVEGRVEGVKDPQDESMQGDHTFTFKTGRR